MTHQGADLFDAAPEVDAAGPRGLGGTWGRLRRHRGAVVGMAIVGFIGLCVTVGWMY